MDSAAAVSVEFDALLEVARWRPLVQWFLGIPHWIIAQVLGYVSGVIWLISFFAVLFTKQIPEGLFNFQVMVMRYRTRAVMYIGFLHDQYPKFEFSVAQQDPGGDPLRLSIARPTELNRWLPLVKWLLAVPHYILLFIFGIGAFVLWILNFFIVLFTGRWNESHRNYLVKVTRYSTRVAAYIMLLNDEYPPFGLS